MKFKWSLGDVRISERLQIEIELFAGGPLEPDEIEQLADLLHWIASAAREWQARAAKATGVRG